MGFCQARDAQSAQGPPQLLLPATYVRVRMQRAESRMSQTLT